MRKPLLLTILMLFCASVCWAQNFDYLTNARQRLSEGECEKAEKNYQVYKDMNDGKRDLELERAIAECKQGKKPSATTAGSTSTQSKNSSSTASTSTQSNSSSTSSATNSDLVFEVGGVKFTMVKVQGGTFTMGQTTYPDPEFSEKPSHKVSLASYYIGQTEVTQALWKAVMGRKGKWNNKHGIGDDYPAYNVSWNDCQEFIKKLNALTGRKFCLPTEAEWEYATCGGGVGHGGWYPGGTGNEVAWHYYNSDGHTHPVAQKVANELGLFDVSGNVCEWCEDWFSDDYYSVSPENNPRGPRTGYRRVIRGGSVQCIAHQLRVTWRGSLEPNRRDFDVGFRLALTE